MSCSIWRRLASLALLCAVVGATPPTGLQAAQQATATGQEAGAALKPSAEALRGARSLALKGKPVTAEVLLDSVEAAEVRRVVSELAVSPPPTERVTPLGCVRELQSRVVEQRISEIQKRVRAASEGALDELLQEQLSLRQRLQELSAQDVTHQ